jgi:hypothetical protein
LPTPSFSFPFPFFYPINQSINHPHPPTPVAAAFCQRPPLPHAPCIDAVIITNQGMVCLFHTNCHSSRSPRATTILPFRTWFISFRTPFSASQSENIQINTWMVEIRADRTHRNRTWSRHRTTVSLWPRASQLVPAALEARQTRPTAVRQQ